MLEIAVIRNKAELVKQKLSVKNFRELYLVDDAVLVDEKRRHLQQQLDHNLNKQNLVAKEIGDLFKQGKKDEAENKKGESAVLKDESKQIEALLVKAEDDLKDIFGASSQHAACIGTYWKNAGRE